MVFGIDGAAVGGEDRLADGQADAHALVGIGLLVADIGISVKNIFQPVRVDAYAVVLDMESDVSAVGVHVTQDRFPALRVDDGIFQQIDQHLLNENGIHGDDEQLIGYGHVDGGFRKPFFQTHDGGGYDLLHGLICFANRGRPVMDAGHRQQVFHHVEQPVGVLVNVGDDGDLLFFREQGAVLQIGGAGADDAGQRCAQVVGDGTQQIGAHLLLLRLREQLVLLGDRPCLFLHIGRHGAGEEGDAEHAQKGDRITGQRKVQFEIGISEQIIHADDGDHGGDHSRQIAVRKAHYGDQCENIDQRQISRILRNKM